MMNVTEKRLYKSCEALRHGGRSLRDMYGIIFSDGSPVMCETASTLRLRRMTYGEIHDRAEIFAAAIREICGGSDAYIGLCAENSPLWTVYFWAILRSGNRPLLLSPNLPASVADGILSGFSARAVLTVDGQSVFGCETLCSAELLERGRTLPPLSADAPFGNAIAAVTDGASPENAVRVYTGEELSEQVLGMEKVIRENRCLTAKCGSRPKQLVLLPLSHVWGFSTLYLGSCFLGATFVFPRSTAPELLIETAYRHDVTHIYAEPAFWHALRQTAQRALASYSESERAAFERALDRSVRWGRPNRRVRELRDILLPDSVRFCLSVGGRSDAADLRLLNGLGYPLYDGYGMDGRGLSSVVLPDRAGERILVLDAELSDEALALNAALNVCNAVSLEDQVFFDGAEIRQRILALFSELLGKAPEEIPGDAHFMIDLGGSSLDYFSLIGELDRTFGIRLPYESDDFAYSLDDFEQLVKEMLKCTNSSVGSR